MSLGLTKPGASAALRHPKTGVVLVPLGYTKSGQPIMPIMGASSDDPDDPDFTGDGDDDLDDDGEGDDDDSGDDEDKSKSKPKDKKPKDDDDEGDESKLSRPERQAARYRTQLREQQRQNAELQARLRKLEDADKPADEVTMRDLEEARQSVTDLTETNRILTAQLAFFRNSNITWVDASDAFALAEREGMFDELIDDSGNVDVAELRRSLRDLAKRKPHLVSKTEDPKARGRSKAKDDEDDDDEPSSSASTVNGNRRGSRSNKPDRNALAKRFPVVGRR